MKKFKTLSYVLLIIVIAVLAIILYSTISRGKENNQQEKGISEIEFLDGKIANLLNMMNNIKTTNYNISVTEITEETEQSNSSSSSNSNSQESESSSESSEGNGNESKGGSESSGSKEQTSSSQTNKKYDLKSAGILNNTTEVDWATVKSEVEVLYTSIPTITLDLYSLNMAQEDILTFNQEFDNLTMAVQEENKETTLEKLSTLYSYLPKFIEKASQDELKIIETQTKSKIFQAYASVEKEDWTVVQDNVKQGIEIFSMLLTSTNIDSSKEYTVNKCYVMLNELQNAVGLQDKAVFYIKYKNLLDEMNAI